MTVLKVLIDVITMDEAVRQVEEFIANKSSHLVATANAEMIMMAQEDQTLFNILHHADLVVPDGAGVVWAARYQGCNMPERVAGFDLTQRLLAEGAKKGYRVYFFGAAPGIAEQAKRKAEALYPGLQVVGVRHGYFTNSEEEEIITAIKAARPDILLAALGVPKQEKWLAAHLAELGVPVCMGVGGTFDVMAGAVKRAPVWMQRANIEWLYRLIKQPQRALRMLALPRFAVRVITGKKD